MKILQVHSWASTPCRLLWSSFSADEMELLVQDLKVNTILSCNFDWAATAPSACPILKQTQPKKKKTPFSIPKNIRVYFTIFQSYRSATQNWLLPLTPGLLHWRWRWWAGPFTNLGSPIHMVRQNKYSMILVIRMSNPNHQCIEKNWTAAGKWHQLQYNTCYIHLAVPSFLSSHRDMQHSVKV